MRSPASARPSSRSSTYSLSVRRAQKGSNVFTRGLLDPLSLTASLTQGRSQTEYTEAQAKTSNLSLGYALQLTRRGFRLPFGGVIRGLPKWLRESEAGRGLASGTFSLTPSSLRASSVWSRDQGDYSSFTIPVFRPDDSAIPPTLSLTHLWRNSAGLSWQPLGMLNLSSDIVSTRDLRVYSDSSSLGRVAYAERRFFLGIPVGVERDRLITTSLSLTPKLTSWLRPRLVTGSSFVLSRTLTSRQPVRVDGDSGEFILPQTYNNARTRELGAALDLSTLLRQVSGDSSKVAVALGRIRPVDFSVRTSLTSTYDLAAFDPSLGYMLALGGLDRFLTQEGVSALGVSDGQTTDAHERRRPAVGVRGHAVVRAHDRHPLSARRRAHGADVDPTARMARRQRPLDPIVPRRTPDPRGDQPRIPPPRRHDDPARGGGRRGQRDHVVLFESRSPD